MNGQNGFLFIVFGGTGDLMGRKLLPALFQLRHGHSIPADVHLLAVARSKDLNDESFRNWAAGELAKAGIQINEPKAYQHLHYQSIGSGAPEDYASLRRRILEVEERNHLPGNRAIYLALPPSAVEPTTQGLGQAGLNQSEGWTRIIIEKPFGYDLASARELNSHLYQHFREDQVYRIDHYLGKETVQNLLVFRFANPVFESVWNRDRVESVHILVAEELGVEGRAGYYDRSGALRDMIQNHLTQLLCLTAMEVPAAFDADSIRDEKVKVLRSVRPISPGDVVFGQYHSNESGSIKGYLEEEGVPANSPTETFVALRLEIANWRWQGVPFFLRTGKRLPERRTKITVRFRCPPVQLFDPVKTCQVASNQLVITLQPQEGFDLHFEVKSPGDEIRMQTQKLSFRYASAFGPLPEAYETLLLDVVSGDQTLFVRGDEAEESWKLYSPILDARTQPHPYEAGSWGPAAVDALYE